MKKRKKKLDSISVKNLQFIFIFFFVAKQQIYPVSYQVRIFFFFKTENEENYMTRAQTGEISYTNITFSDQSLSPTVILLYLCSIQ